MNKTKDTRGDRWYRCMINTVFTLQGPHKHVIAMIPSLASTKMLEQAVEREAEAKDRLLKQLEKQADEGLTQLQDLKHEIALIEASKAARETSFAASKAEFEASARQFEQSLLILEESKSAEFKEMQGDLTMRLADAEDRCGSWLST